MVKHPSKAAAIIIHHLLTDKSPLPILTCPVTFQTIRPNTSSKEIGGLLKDIINPRHYTWMGCHYVQTIHPVRNNKIVKMFDTETLTEMAYAGSDGMILVRMD